MTPGQIIVVLCWLVFSAYWGLNWKNVKPTKEQKFNFGNIRWLFAGIIILAVFNQFAFNDLFEAQAPQSLLLEILSIILSISGLMIAVIARRTLAGNWSHSLDVKKEHKLITTGVYSHIRHPIYTGVIMMLLATLIIFLSFGELLIFIFLSLFFLFRIQKEESLMTKTFPKEYPKYKKRTKALLPYIY